jgi:hypothetical protein
VPRLAFFAILVGAILVAMFLVPMLGGWFVFIVGAMFIRA